jgi:hypothetical protein
MYFNFHSSNPHIKWVPRAISLGVKRSGREANHSPPSTAEVKNTYSCTSTPPIRLHGVVLNLNKRRRDNFTFTSRNFRIKILSCFVNFVLNI